MRASIIGLLYALCFSELVLGIQLKEHKILQKTTNLDTQSSKANEEKLQEYSKELEDNMSLSEIIQKRFKRNIKIKKLWKPEEVEQFIIQKPTANDESNVEVSLIQTLSENYRQFKLNARMKLSNLILAQKAKVQHSRVHMYSSNYDSTHGISSYMIAPFIVSLLSVLLICCLGRCCLVPVVKACDYELNNRGYQRRTNKDTLIQQAIVQRCAQAVIKESYDKIEEKRIKERNQIVQSTVFKEDEYQAVKILSSQNSSQKGMDQGASQGIVSENQDQQSGQKSDDIESGQQASGKKKGKKKKRRKDGPRKSGTQNEKTREYLGIKKKK